MKIIDLLNKIANGEEVPHIQYDDTEAYLGADGYLKDNYGDNVEWWIDKEWLNTEVEIIEEEKKIPEKINKSYNIRILDLDKPHTIKDYDMEQLIEMVQDIYSKQSEILDYLKNKGE